MSANPKILVIDDDVRLTELLSEYLKQNGLEVIVAGTPDIGLKQLQFHHPSVVILDVMLPGRDGFAVCREIRARSQVPIIMLTARGDVTDRVVGLEMGADDYLPKPFEPRELLARLKSLMRRGSSSSESTRLVFGDLVIDSDSRRVTLGTQELDVSTMEFDILRLLASNPARIFNRDQIKAHLHGVDWSAEDRAIDVLISRLRQKLGEDPKHPRFLKTVRGTGYKFIAGGTKP